MAIGSLCLVARDFKRSITQYYGEPVRLLLVVVVYSEGVCDHPCSSKALLMVGCRTKLLVVSLYSLIIGRDFWIGGSRCPRLWRLLYLASSPWSLDDYRPFST